MVLAQGVSEFQFCKKMDSLWVIENVWSFSFFLAGFLFELLKVSLKNVLRWYCFDNKNKIEKHFRYFFHNVIGLWKEVWSQIKLIDWSVRLIRQVASED